MIQAFRNTPVPVNRRNHCGLVNIRKFIYLSLHNAGVENRSPFTLLQLIKIRRHSLADAEQVRLCCIEAVLNIQKPVGRFQSSHTAGFVSSLILSLSLLLAPKTATTFLSPVNGHSILEEKISSEEDLEKAVISLPFSSDYVTAAFETKSIPVVEKNGLRGVAWIQVQSDLTYSLQLMTASNSENISKFCRQHDICDQSAYYPKLIKGNKMYRLIYGVYSNYKAAKIAQAQLPENLRTLSSWARQFKQIKQEL